MNRNQNSRFALNPTNMEMNRSTFDRDSSLKTTFNVGDIVPIYVDEVLPGDTFKVKSSRVVRLQTPITPFMDNLYLDTYYFFVPNRLVWEHWKQFMGENTDSAWIPETTYQVPMITAPAETGFEVGTIADYFGVPTGIPGLEVNALPFRGLAMICNEWFRDQNLVSPLYFPVNDTTVVGSNGSNYIEDVAKGGKPFKAAKYHDYFTSALPAPQKGNDVGIGLTGSIPVVGNGYGIGLTANNTDVGIALGTKQGSSMQNYTINISNDNSNIPIGTVNTGSAGTLRGSAVVGLTTDADKSGIVGDLSGLSTISINALRIAFQTQKFLEQQARSGSRYTEILKGFFGVTSPDSRLQRPEYLGGDRQSLNVNQVLANSETSDQPLGTTGAYSLTNSTNFDFEKSFTEHGFIIGVAVARYDHTYQQGLNRMWSRKDKYDYYWPVFSSIGEVGIKNKELYAQGPNAINPDTGVPYDEEIFGYQEAWADYRYKPSITTGEMRSTYAQSLDIWHLGDDYDSLPKLSADWIFEDKSNVDRVLQVTSSVSNQIFMDCFFKNETTRIMPLYSIPGLIDHH